MDAQPKRAKALYISYPLNMELTRLRIRQRLISCINLPRNLDAPCDILDSERCFCDHVVIMGRELHRS